MDFNINEFMNLSIIDKKELKKTLTKLLQPSKKELNKQYYEKNKDKHLNTVKQYYNDKIKNDKVNCNCCNKSYLKCKFDLHLNSNIHKKKLQIYNIPEIEQLKNSIE